MKSKHKPHRHPPQPKLMSHKAEANKSLVIGIIAIIAVVGLGLLLFFSKQFVGQAIHEAPIGEDQAGFFVTAGSTTKVGEMFVLPVTVKISSGQSVAGSFEFTYPANLLDVDCASIFKEVDSVFIVDGNDLSVFKNYSCSNGKVSWQFAGLCDETCSNALSPGQSIDIAKIRFYPKHAGKVELKFTSFNIIDLDTGNDLIGDGNDAVFNLVEGAPSEECGDGKVDAGESCDDGNINNSDGCSASCGVESGWNCVGVLSKCCSDSDGGYNLSIKGWAIGASEITLSFGKYNDSCTNQTSIVEMTCTTGNFVRANTQECPGGKSCSDGACIAAFCPAGKECCGGTVEVNNLTDSNNCGTCGNKCSSGQTCKVGECTAPTLPPIPEKPIDVKLTPTGSSDIATTSVGKKEYDITVTLTPSVNLSANYLMIASVNYGSKQSTKLIEGNNAALTKDSSKTFGFKHTVDGTATNLTVSVMVWNGYLTEGFNWIELVPQKDKPYEIK